MKEKNGGVEKVRGKEQEPGERVKGNGNKGNGWGDERKRWEKKVQERERASGRERGKRGNCEGVNMRKKGEKRKVKRKSVRGK